MSNKIVHWEIMGPNGAAMKQFYEAVFGWSAQAVPGFDEYHMVDAEATGVGGAVGKGSAEMPRYLTLYVEVPSIDEALTTIEAAGGSTLVPRTVVPGVVVFAMFSDPAGNVVGLVEPDMPATD